jgi:hypothetical protein
LSLLPRPSQIANTFERGYAQTDETVASGITGSEPDQAQTGPPRGRPLTIAAREHAGAVALRDDDQGDVGRIGQRGEGIVVDRRGRGTVVPATFLRAGVVQAVRRSLGSDGAPC